METAKFISYIYFAAFAGVIPPGLVNMAVAKIAISKDKKNGIYAAIGVCVVNFLHALIAVLMARYILKHTGIQDNMLKIGVAVFAGLTVYFFAAAIKNKPQETKVRKKDSKRSFAKGFFVANLNILPIPYFVFISTQLNTKGGFDWWHIFLFAFSAAAGTFTVLYFYVVAFMKIQKRTQLLSKYANYFMAALMFVLFLITLYRAYNGL